MIDLDLAEPRPADAPDLRLRVPRALLLLVVAVLALGGLSASAVSPAGLTPVLSAGGTAAAAFTLGSESLYTASYGVGNPNSESAIRRWSLTDGSLSWAAALPQGVQNLVVDEGAGVLMARSGTDPRISVLDARTGDVLWGSEAANTSVVTVARAGLLFTTDVPGATVLRLAEPKTGRTVWTRTVDARVYFGPDDLWSRDPTRIVAVGTAGTVLTLDFATGSVLSRGELGGPLRPVGLGNSDGALVNTVGDNRLVVNRRELGGTELSAYSLTPFTRLWQRTDAPVGTTADCAAVWCLAWLREGVGRNGDPGGVTAIDPADGTTRWGGKELSYADRFPGYGLIAARAGEMPDLLLLDPATGRPVRTLGQVVWIGGNLLMHPDTKVPVRAWVTVYDPRDRSVHPVGDIETGAAFGCETLGRYLACPTAAGPTRVWRLPEVTAR